MIVDNTLVHKHNAILKQRVQTTPSVVTLALIPLLAYPPNPNTQLKFKMVGHSKQISPTNELTLIPIVKSPYLEQD